MSNLVTISPQSTPLDPLGWILDTCLPFWAERGVDDKTGGFIERLDYQAQVPGDDYTRIRVQARQLYVFSHAYHLSGDQRFADVANRGFGFLKAHGLQAGVPGWVHMITPSGTLLDSRRDCYDLAFILFALGWYQRATGDAEATPLIAATLDFLDRYLAESEHGGFVEERLLDEQNAFLPGTTLPRRQNPHMHLLEAFLTLYEATGEKTFLDRAAKIVELFRTRFLDRETGSLGEFFTHDWQPAMGSDGALREPGHHFEWVWLLQRYAALSGDDSVIEHATALYDFTLKYGVRQLDGLPVAIDSVDRHGAVLSPSARLWPQTEMIKAGLAHNAITGNPASRALAADGLATLFRFYLDREHGYWCDQIDDNGAPLSGMIPASSLYHIMMAVTEWHRLGGNI